MTARETTPAAALALAPRQKAVLSEATSNYTHETVPTQFVEAEGIRYAYRRSFDNAGVGASGGETPYTVMEMTHHCVAFCLALGLKAIHVVGFSLGGMIAQQLALDHPHLVQRLILLGTGPRGGGGMTFIELSPEV